MLPAHRISQFTPLYWPFDACFVDLNSNDLLECLVALTAMRMILVE